MNRALPNWKRLDMKKSGNVYNLHSYWTKQPVEIVEEFIKFFSNKGDTVLDCFAGTGMTGVASKKNNRKSILYDLSPICCEISRGYTTKIKNYPKLIEEFDNFKKIFENKFNDLVYFNYDGKKKRIKYILYSRDYLCPKCKNKFNSFEEEVAFLRGSIRAKDKCPNCGFSDYKEYIPKDIQIRELTLKSNPHSIRVKPTEEFIAKLEKLPNIKFPTDFFWGREPKRNYKIGITQVYQLYSKFNRVILYEILSYINGIKDENIKNIFRFTFSSILFNCSLLSAYTKYENTAYRTGTYYIPRIIKDNNPLDSFYSKFDLIIKTINNLYDQDTQVTIYNKSATKMSEISSNSIDYVYIDPPYSDVINYSELNLVWESWLGLKTNHAEEIIVNKEHSKDESFYEEKMNIVFSELNRVLKKEGILTLIFHHPKPDHWGIIQRVTTKNKFILLNKTPIQIRSKSRTHSQINTSKPVQGFLALNFMKADESKNLKALSQIEFLSLLTSLKEEAKKEGYVDRPDVYDYIITKLYPTYCIVEFKI